jgi:hypothetical protein
LEERTRFMTYQLGVASGALPSSLFCVLILAPIRPCFQQRGKCVAC